MPRRRKLTRAQPAGIGPTGELLPGTEVWAYLRVSSDPQAEAGTPIAGQREAVNAYVGQHGLLLTRTFVDEGASAASDRRDQFLEMMAALKERQPAGIIFWEWSRFSRNQNDAHFWKATIRHLGVKLITLNDNVPQVDGFEYIIEAFIHWKDEQKLHEVGTGARRGQQTLARLGFIPGGHPPRGYRAEVVETLVEGRPKRLRRWVPDEATWPLVRRAWDLRLLGAGYDEILRETHLYKGVGCLTTMFANTAYKGEIYYGDTLIRIPPLVTEEEWQRVQELAHGPRRRGGSYLLTGLLRCGECGGPMCGSTSSGAVRNDGYARRPWRFYICADVAAKGECRARRAGAAALEQAVIAEVLRVALSEETAADYIAGLGGVVAGEANAVRASLRLLEDKLTQCERAITRLAVAIESADDAAPILARLRERQAERHALATDIAGVRAQLERLQLAPGPAAARAALAEALSGSGQFAHTVLRSLVERIIVTEGRVQIEFRHV